MNKNIDYLNIFVKQSEIVPEINILSKKEILDSIPINYQTTKNTILETTHIEWRWRFFKFPNKKNETVEISYKSPNKKRKYIDKTGEWVERDISNDIDNFVISEYYHYTNN